MRPLSAYVLLFLGLLLFSSCSVRRKSHAGEAVKNTASLPSGISKHLKKEVNVWLGVPYRLGGTDQKGIDCSALVCAIYKAVYAKNLPRTTSLQFAQCKRIPLSKLQEGDLVFFNPSTKDVSHVGLYLRDQQFIHASVSKGVVISNLDNPYYKKCFVSGGRF